MRGAFQIWRRRLNRSAPHNASQIGIDAPETIRKCCWTCALNMHESDLMVSQPYQIYVERRDASRNMSRFYTLSIGATLFGDVQLTRRWGRIGSRGQAMSHTFAREADAVRLFLDLLRHKRKRGYRPRGKAAVIV